MMGAWRRRDPRQAVRHMLISLAAASPFLLLQTAVVLFPDGRSTQFFGSIVVFVLLIPLLLLYCLVEWRWRLQADQTHLVPWFGIAGLLSLATFFLPALAVYPIISRIPAFCSIVHRTEWSTTLVTSDGTPQSFNLILSGTGTKQLSFGHLHWSGEEDADIQSIGLQPLTFVDRHGVMRPGSYRDLRSGMAQSGLEQSEVDVISRDVWRVVEAADRGLTITPSHGVASVYSYFDGRWDLIIGGAIWMLAVFALFQFVGRKTLGRDPLVPPDG